MDESSGPLESFGHHRRVLIKALAQLFPPADVFVELDTNYIPTRRERRQVELIDALVRRVNRLEDKVDSARVLTEPYADLFEDVMASVTTRRGLDKREHYAAVLANALVDEAPAWDRQERMIACLDALRPSHLWLLALVVRDLASHPKTSESVVGAVTGFRIPLPEGTDFDLVDRDWRDMVGWGMFEGLENHGMVGPAAQTTAIDNVAGSTYLKGTIRPFGLEFAAFVAAEDATDPGS